MMQWHYQADDGRHGPLDTAGFRKLVETGIVNDETLVWADGMAGWQRLADVDMGDGRDSQTEDFKSASVVCTQCGERRTVNQTVSIYGNLVCATCKPLFIHRIKESVVSTDGSQLASFLSRAGARIIDQILLTIIQFVVVMPIFFLTMAVGDRESSAMPIVSILMLWVGQFTIMIGYEILFLGRWGATPGKMLCRIKVVLPGGGKLTWGRAAGRGLAHLLTGFTMLIGYIIAAFDGERRALHDMICNTRVMRVS